MSDSLLNIIFKATDMASGVISKINTTADNLSKQGLASMNNGFQATSSFIKTGLVTGLLAGSIAMGGLVTSAIKGAGSFEQYRATLTTMLGSQELANQRLKEYAEIGAKTPFELPQVVALGNQLQAIGKYSRDNVNMLGDLASAAGKPIEQVSGAFSKLATGQKGVAVDMFRDLLITTDDWVKATGKGISKSGELMATTEEMMAVLPKIMADKKFSGMMEQQSATLIGKLSNLSDAWASKLREVGEKILPYVKPYIDQLIAYISSIAIDAAIKKVTDTFELLRSKLSEVLIAIEPITSNSEIMNSIFFGLATVIGVLLVGAFLTMATALVTATAPFVAIAIAAGAMFYLFQTNVPLFAAVLAMLAVVLWVTLIPALWAKVTALYAVATAWIVASAPLILLITGIGLLVFAISWLVQNWDTVTAFIKNSWEVVVNFVTQKLDVLGNWFSNTWNSILVLVNNVGHAILSVIISLLVDIIVWHAQKLQEGVQKWQQLFDIVVNAANGFKGRVVGVFQSIGDAISSAISSAMSYVSGAINANINLANKAIDIANNIPGVSVPNIPAFVGGVTNFGGGMAIVGERGPELVHLPRGSSVYSNRESNQMLSGKGGDIIVNLSLNSLIPDTRMVHEVVNHLENELKKRFKTA